MKKGLIKRLGIGLLSALMCLTSLSLMPVKVQAATVDHGAVKIVDTDYDAIWARLKAKYPSVFVDGKVYINGVESGTIDAVRVLFTRSTTHLQAGNQGATEVFINGTTAGTSNSAYGLSSFLNNEVFTVNGQIGYCFDWLTPSRTGQHVQSSSLAEAGINVRSGVDVIGLAEAAKMLTKDNFALITNNANQLAMSLTVPASSYNNSITIPKSAVVQLLQDTSADATAFKRGLVQMMVWGTMNDLPYSDYMYYFISDSGYWDKEGNWHAPGSDGSMRTAPIIGIAGFIDIPKMYQLGYQAYQSLKTSVTQTADWERQYELEVGKPFSVPAADVPGIGKILDENGGKIEPSGTVQVNRSSDGKTITLTATQPISSWTAWQGVTEDSSMIYSSKPYNSSYNNSSGTRVPGSGQFIVDVSAVKYFRARVKAVVSDAYAYLQKSATVPNGQSGYSLEGAVYGVYASEANAKSDSGRLETLTTNASGKSATVKLKVGTYYVKEITAPAGFALDTSVHSVTLTAANTSDKPAVIEVSDVPLFGSAKVVKVSDDGKVEGLTFKLEGPVIRQAKTDAAGSIEFSDLPYGSYTITEVLTAEQKKIYKAEGPWTFTLSATQTSYTVNAHNGLLTKDVKVKKTSEDGAKKGFTFQLIGQTVNGMQITRTGTTDANGEIDFGQIPKGTYTVQEVNVPDQYVSPDPQTFDVGDSDVTVTFVNRLKVGTIEITKKTDDGVLKGFKFHLSGKTIGGKTYEADAMSNAQGIATFTGVPYGDYVVSEVDVPVRYIIPENQSITLSTAGPAKLIFVNETSSKVTVKKTSSDGIISGISFSLKGKATFTGEEIVRSAMTNNEGFAVFEDLPAGQYRIEETGVKDWYTVSPAYRDVTLAAGDEKEVSFTNTLKTGSLVIQKRVSYPSEEGITRPETPDLSGFSFTITGISESNMGYTATKSTNKNGKVSFSDIPVGAYRITENLTSAQKKVFIETDGETVLIESGKTVQFEKTNESETGTGTVAKIADDGNIEGLSFKLEGTLSADGSTITLTKKTDSNGRIDFGKLPFGSYTITEVLTAAQKKIYKAEGPWIFVLDKDHPSVTVNAHNSLITKDVKVKKTAEDGAKKGFTFQLIGQTVNGMQITRTGTTDASGEIDFGQIPKGTYTVQEVNVPDQYVSPDPQTFDVGDSDVTVTFANKLKVGTIEITKKTDDGVLKGFKFHLSGKTIGGKTYEADATTNEQGIATFTGVPYGDYVVSEVDVPVRYIVPENQSITLSTAGPTKLIFVNETSSKVTVKKTSSDGIISGISFSLKGKATFTGEEIVRSAMTNNEGIAVFEDLPAGQYRIEETGVKDWYTVSPAYRDVTLAAGDEKEVSFTNMLKTGSVKIVKTSEDGKLQGFTFKLEGYALNEKFYSFEATTDENGVATFPKVPIGGPYQVTEILNEDQKGLYKTVEIRDIFVKENEATEIPVYNELNRYTVRVVKTSESGILKGYEFELSGTDTAGREVLLKAVTDADGIAEFKDVAPGSYRVREVNTPVWFVVPKDQTVTVKDSDVDLNFVNDYQTINVLIRKVNEDGVVEGFTFILSGKAVSGETIYREITTDKDGKATFERVPWGSYTVSEAYTEFQEKVYLPTASRTLKVESESTDKTLVWTNRLRKFEVSVVKTSENDDIEGKTFRLFGTSLTGVEIDITKNTDKDGHISFGQIPLGEYTVSELETPFWFIQPEDQTVIVKDENVEKSFYNELARGTILINKQSEDSMISGFVFRLNGISYGGISVDEVATTDENGIARFKEIPYGEFTVTEELNEEQAYVYVQNEAFTIDLRQDEVSADVLNSLIRQKVQVVKTSENDEIEGIVFHLHGETVNGMKVDETAATNAEGIAEFAAEKGGIPRGSYTIEEVDTKFYYIEPEAQDIEVAKEDQEVSFYNELQKADLEVSKSSEDGVLKGFTFRLYGTAYSGVEVDATAVTDENGLAVFEQIPWGEFTLEEVLNEDQAYVYKVNAAQNVKLIYTEKESASFRNELIRQKVKVVKTSENEEVEGITFHLFGKTVNGMEVDETAITNAEGIAEFAAEKGGIPHGTYIIEEVDTKFYFVEPQPVNLELGADDAEVCIYNELQKADLEVIKSSEDGVLEGFRFHLYGTAYSGVEVDLYAETDAEGKAVFEQVPWGEFALEEVLNEDEAYVYKVDAGKKVKLLDTDHEQAKFTNELIRQKVQVTKTSEDGQLEGFVFRLTGKTVNGMDVEEYATTNAEGVAEFAADKGGIPRGTYTIDEVETPEYFEQPEAQEAFVGTDDLSLSFFNRNKRGEIELVKKDADLGDLLAGSVFSIYEWDGEGFVFLKDMTDGGDGSYVAAGLIWTKQNEGRFEVRETKAPEGYFLLRNDGENDFTVSFSEDGLHPLLAAANMKPEITTEVQIPMIPATDKVTITDSVSYHNLLIGKTYTVSGILMDKETGEALLVDGKEVIAETAFTAESADGSIDVVFELDASKLAGKTLVVFETLFIEGEEGNFPKAEDGLFLIADHADIEDEAQTVYIPKIWTDASDFGSKEKSLYGVEMASVVDAVSFENLIPGQTYTVKGELVDQGTGEGTGITAEVSFTAEDANGSVELVFTFDGSQYIGKDLVVFERIYDADGNLIGLHEDLDDPAQTVTVIDPPTPPETGDDSHLIFWGILGVLSLIGVALLSRKIEKDQDND